MADYVRENKYYDVKMVKCEENIERDIKGKHVYNNWKCFFVNDRGAHLVIQKPIKSLLIWDTNISEIYERNSIKKLALHISTPANICAVFEREEPSGTSIICGNEEQLNTYSQEYG